MNSVYVIAEAGVNHCGSLELALKLVDAAVESGADAVKFQTFKASRLVTREAKKAKYQLQKTASSESQYEMLKKLELSEEDHASIYDYCSRSGIEFLSTPFDIESALFLCDLGVGLIKIPSGEVTNLPYLRVIGGVGKKIILSTGMCMMTEVQAALKVLIESGADKKDVVILHANTEYPTPIQDVNLRAMTEISRQLNVKVGYSDHTLGIHVPIAAVAMGAVVIEKHFTLDRGMEGPDHRASLEPRELASMVHGIRQIEVALGDGVKKPSSSEIPNIPIARKSIVAASRIIKGEVFTEDNLTVKRPGMGISPMMWDEVIGTKAERDYVMDDFI